MPDWVDCSEHKPAERLLGLSVCSGCPDLIFSSSVCLSGTHIAEDRVCNKSCINLSDCKGGAGGGCGWGSKRVSVSGCAVLCHFIVVPLGNALLAALPSPKTVSNLQKCPITPCSASGGPDPGAHASGTSPAGGAEVG